MNSDEPLFPERFTLNNGVQMPSIGLGTYKIIDQDIIFKAIDNALNAGYRMFDTAAVYNNEAHMNKAFKKLLPKYGLTRQDIFITTKLSPKEHGGTEAVYAAIQRSLENLGVDYIDLFLMHFPGTAKLPAQHPHNAKLRALAWEGIKKLYDERLVKSIGVSNFTKRHLNEVLLSGNGIVPAVNQVEWHPFYYDYDMLKFCKEHNIVLQAYSSFGGTSSGNYELIKHPVVCEIASKHHASTTQVLLVWALQQDIAVIPKSTNPLHIKENINLDFKLTADEIKALDALGTHKMKYAWDPNHVY